MFSPELLAAWTKVLADRDALGAANTLLKTAQDNYTGALNAHTTAKNNQTTSTATAEASAKAFYVLFGQEAGVA